jgi:eukaryotic-like serine/threonine-protein kinase
MNRRESIAHYRIVSKLGEGGMGAVYRATDTKLNRDVAIKVLPDAFASDPERLTRFTREAQVLASLNHPNIAAIYGVEERALVLELVEGLTLAERIAQGALPLDEALPIARQIAEALEYAHEKGIVHRDLKPGNIKLTPDGRVKVLDFGLAKALSNDGLAADPANSPTITMRATVAGMIMGTAGYMSPEQAKGKPVDRRADIWAYGVLFVEMLSGREMYAGETVSEMLAAVIKDTPDLSGLPMDTPPSVRRMIQRCLDKDPQRRLQAIGEARIALDDTSPLEPSPAAGKASSRLPWIRWPL